MNTAPPAPLILITDAANAEQVKGQLSPWVKTGDNEWVLRDGGEWLQDIYKDELQGTGAEGETFKNE